MKTITLQAPAKINLALDVIGTRPDGYHLLETVFQEVGIYDRVTVAYTPSERLELSLTCDQPSIPTDQRNIAWKAAERFCTATNRTGKLAIHIEKHIPAQAGMGGGSTDGAAVLTGLQTLFDYPCSKEQLLAIAVGLGADVPFFLYGGTAYAAGIGEELEPLPPLQISHLVIAKGKLGVSTKEAYQAVDSLVAPKHPPVQEMRQLLKQGEPVEKIAPLCGNLFETAISLPEIHRIRTVMLEQGAWTSVMTGSGSAVFGIFPEEETAIAAGDALRKADVDFVQVLSQKERVLSYEPITHR